MKSELPTGRDTIFVTTTARMPKSIVSLRESDGLAPRSKWRALPERSREAGTKLRDTPPPLLLIDGRKSTEAALAVLDPKDIASMEVYKGEKGAQLFGDPAAASGVIVVTTKAAKK